MACTFTIRLLRRSFYGGNFLPLRLIPALPILGTASATSKHWDPKYRKLRAKKVLKVILPNFDRERNDKKLTMEEMRTKIKERGIAPPRNWVEKPMLISNSGEIFDPYIPPEGDGKMSFVSSPGLKQKYEVVGKKGKSYMALRKIRNFDYDFDVPIVAEQSQEIYIEAMKAMTENNEDRLHELVTEKCYPEMMDHMKNKTVHWKFMKSLEPARCVHVRAEELLTKGSLFAQVTVRFHTQQTLAIYDRFGRLIHGSEETLKDVLEYLVLEKQIMWEHSTWRIHGKIIPDWAPARDSPQRTYIWRDFEETPKPEDSKSSSENLKPETEANIPALA